MTRFIIFLLAVVLVACGSPIIGGENTNNNNVSNSNQDGGVQQDSEPDQDGGTNQNDAQVQNDVDPLVDGDVEEDGTVEDDGAVEEDGTVEDDGGTNPVCGDGVVDPGEVCDDGNTNDWDACNNDCQGACGNGLVDGPTNPSQPDYGEECDSGSSWEPNENCQENCMEPTCGDGVCNWYSFFQLSAGVLTWVAEDGTNCPQDCMNYAPAYTPGGPIDCAHQIVPLQGGGQYAVVHGDVCPSGECVVHQSSIPGWENGLPNAGPYTDVRNCGACNNHCTSSEWCQLGVGCVSVF